MDPRITDLATKGLSDPASLKPQEVREICAAILNGIAPPAPAQQVAVSPPGPGFVVTP